MISVVMPCYREPQEMFSAALESILGQTYRDLDIIVIVDGANRELEEVLSEYVQRDSRLRFFVNEENRGLPYSLNRGISIAQGDYIARMDADDIALPKRLEKEMSYLEVNNLELMGTYCEIISDDGKHVGFMRGPTNTAEIYRTLSDHDCIAHPTWLFHKSVWERVGGYDNFRHCQDYHFLLKARKKGVRLGVMAEICLQYRLSAGGIGRKKLLSYPATGDYLAAHAEDIFSVTPETLRAYLESEEGESRMREIGNYLELLEKFRNTRWFKLWYGIKLFRMAYGRERLYKKLRGRIEVHI